MSVLAALLLPAIIVRFYQGWFQMLYIDLPLLIAATGSVSTFYLGCQRELFPGDWKRTLRFLPLILATGIGLTVTNTWAVLEALFGSQSEFVRTPKYHIRGRRGHFFGNVYGNRARWVALVEILIGCYFVFAVYYAFTNQNYATSAFLALFVLGYLGGGLFSVLQRRWDWLTHVLSNYVPELLRISAK
jgi:hypothetical protein